MKRFVKKLLACVCAAVMCFAFTACSPVDPNNPDNPGGGGNTEKIDTSRTQLYVFNFYGGYGSDWLTAAKARYEELHKDDVYEDGKKGIQIIITSQKTSIEALTPQILDNRDEIYFTEYAYYYTLKAAGVLGDITEAVTADLSSYGDSAGSTIEKKLSAEQKAYYGIAETDGKTHYYALPHYSGYSGLIYNVELFEDRGYYFIDNPQVSADSPIEDYFIYNKDDKRSAGPDGEYNTADDGLPSTYDEFFMLCDYIYSGGETPVVWNGANNKDYINNLLQALVADYEGLDQMMINYTLGGEEGAVATDLGTIQNGRFVEDASDTTIVKSNAYEIFRQAGKYYGLKFVEKLMTTDKYHNDLAFNSGYSHMNAQEDFLYAGNDTVTDPIAMLCDGIWWEAEATTTFNEMADSKGDAFSKMGRKFAFMPLPKANSGKINGKNTLFDHIYSLCFMKANIADWKKPIAYDFIKFIHSDASLVEYSQITNTPKAFNYNMTAEQMSGMSYFGRSVMELKQKSDVVYPYSTSTVYVNNQSRFGTHSMYYSDVNGTERQWPSTAIGEEGNTAEDYFSGMYSFYKDDWGSSILR